MQVNPALSAQANLLALINISNTANSLALTEAQVTISVPVPRTSDSDTRNTKVTISPVTGQGFAGPAVPLTYNRRQLNENVIAPPTSLNVRATTTMAQFKTAVAVAWGLVETEFTVEGTLPVADNTTSIMTLTAIANSLLFIGSKTITASRSEPALASVLLVTNQSGFDPAT